MPILMKQTRIQTRTSRRAPYTTILFFLLCPALAALQNVTIDDALLTGSVVPQYLPNASSWHVGNNCSVCHAQPDPALAYNHTWHDATLFPNTGASVALQFSFSGTALYVFFILANNITDAGTAMDLNFTLDGAPAGTFVHNPGPMADYEYNVPVYANASLDAGAHTMLVQPVAGLQSLMLFDYLIYTTDTPNATSSSTPTTPTPTSISTPTTTSSPGSGATSSSPNIGAIVGGTIGGVAAVLLTIAALLVYRRDRRRRAPDDATAMAFMPHDHAPPSGPFLSGKGTATPPVPVSDGTQAPPPASPSMLSTNSALTRAGSDTPGLVEQLDMLRNEVARLRRLQETVPATPTADLSEAPPEYA